MKHLYKGEKLLLEQFLSRTFFFMMLMLLSYVWVILSQNSFLVVPAQVQQLSTF